METAEISAIRQEFPKMRLEAGELILDRDRREVLVAGVPVHLSPKAYVLLESLMTSAPSAISKEDLYRNLWGDTFVEEANIPNLISEVRAAIGDDPSEPTYIMTVRGYGYRFLLQPRKQMEESLSPFMIIWQSKRYPLAMGQNLLGRDPGAAVVIDWGGVSRRHARISVDADGAAIEDLESKNGTFVGPDKVQGEHPLKPGDLIRLGSVSLAFQRLSRSEETFTEAISPSQNLEKP